MGAYAYCPKCDRAMGAATLAEAFKDTQKCGYCGSTRSATRTFEDALSDFEAQTESKLAALLDMIIALKEQK